MSTKGSSEGRLDQSVSKCGISFRSALSGPTSGEGGPAGSVVVYTSFRLARKLLWSVLGSLGTPTLKK